MIQYFFETIELNSVINSLIGGLILWAIFKIAKYSQRLPSLFMSFQKASRYKQLNKIKNNRQDERHYLYELQKAQNWFIIFLATLILSFIWLVNNNVLEYSLLLFLICMLPTFILEIVWLNKLSYVQDLGVYQKGNLEWKKRRQRKIRRKIKQVKRLR